MSLIYQALKQSEQRAMAPPSLVVQRAVDEPKEGNRPNLKVGSIVSLGVVMAAAGVLIGYFLTQGSAAPESSLTLQQTALSSGAGTNAKVDMVAASLNAADLTNPSRDTTSLALIEDPPLPIAAPQPIVVATYLPELKKAVVLAAPASDTSAQSKPPADPVVGASLLNLDLAAQPTAAIASKTVEVPTLQPATDDMRMLFDALNQALEGQDKALAQSKLQGIQSRLAESSVARLRAESWFAHQTGDLDNAIRIYRRLLEKMPGDELTSVNLAAIEKKRQRSDEAKAVLTKALRQNPSSVVLRSAVEQLVQGEVRP